MDRTPIGFQAARQRVGMGVADVAHALGINPNTVKRWESPASAAEPFEQAWEMLERELTRHRTQVEAGLDAIERAGEDDVTLPYWPSEAAWHAANPRSPISARMANATIMATAEAAEALGHTVRFALPDTELVREMLARAEERRSRDGRR